jgi:hypothetical protein
MYFHLDGNIQINGVEVSSQEGSAVLFEGDIKTTSSNEAAISRALGLKNIANAVGADEYLDGAGLGEIVDYLQRNGLFGEVAEKMMDVQHSAAA